jgi:hypothetical protein
LLAAVAVEATRTTAPVVQEQMTVGKMLVDLL